MTRAEQPGIMIISLDFELYWGVRDSRSLVSYRENLKGVSIAIPAILKLFRENDIHATWATVGFLFHDNQEQLLESLPGNMPNYSTTKYSPYQYIQQNNLEGTNRTFHFAPDLINTISATPGQEIGTHTYSHYYCLEDGQTIKDFEEDIKMAAAVGDKKDIKLKSLVFPRNQFNESYLRACYNIGIKAVRGNERSWVYRPGQKSKTSLFRRGIRLIDAYLNLTGHHTYIPSKKSDSIPLNLPSSRFLRPVSKKLKLLEPLRLRRIVRDIEKAAKSGEVYHIWWHPHNFGRDLDQNIEFLSEVLLKYNKLNEKGLMKSMSMAEYSMSFEGLKNKAI